MSQEKVDRYKKEKANRRATLAKAKKKKLLVKILSAVACLAIVLWIGYAVYDNAQDKANAIAAEVNLEPIQEYLSTL